MLLQEKTEIRKIEALEILDSRSNPTVMCRVTLASGAQGCAQVPSGLPRGSTKLTKSATAAHAMAGAACARSVKR